ncbi:MAG: TolC family protein [Ignavibacteriales bacterium]
MLKRKLSITLSLIILFIVPVSSSYAEDTAKTVESTIMKISIKDAIALGIEHSIPLKLVSNQIALNNVYYDQAELAGHDLKKAGSNISHAKTTLAQVQEQVNAISDPAVKAAAQAQVDASAQKISSGEDKLDSASATAGGVISDKIGTIEFSSITPEDAAKLMESSASINYEVSKASYDIYKNQLAMLIQNDYYDVLKMQKIVEVKNKAMQRGKTQYEFSLNSYSVGMKAKDDMLLSSNYYDSTRIEYSKAIGELNNALTALKKDMNIPLDTKLELTESLSDESKTVSLEEGIKSGLANRLEMKKSLGEALIYTDNFNITKANELDYTFKYREAKLLEEKAILNLQQTKLNVESSIRQSFETLNAVSSMLKASKEMVSKASEGVEIANTRYKTGLKVNNQLMKTLQIESSSGTIVESLAAEEKLSEIEEKTIEILYSYNMAKAKYNNDCGIFIY